MFMRESFQLNGKELSFETGRMAKQADGSVVIRYGDSMVLVTAVGDNNPKNLGFLPLTVDYREKTYAAGKIPGSFFRREGRPQEFETLTSRIIDRPCRPLFPDGYEFETQIIATVLSADCENMTDVLALTGASAALSISSIPWAGPVAGVRVGRINGEFIANPTVDEIEKSDLNIVMAASREAIVMVEGQAKEVDEEIMIDGLLFGHEAVQPMLDIQDRMRAALGKEKREFISPVIPGEIAAEVEASAKDQLLDIAFKPDKLERYASLDTLKSDVVSRLTEKFPEQEAMVKQAFNALKTKVIRDATLDGRRIDGRKHDEVRKITCEVGVLPRTHGSALFTRGETQALVTTTLGTTRDQQRIDTLTGDEFRNFLLHYNFPPYSVNEARPNRGTSRRETGHGVLAWRSLENVLPDEKEFPYTIRVVSEIMESNGSSSMATVCGGTLALMDAGVPITAPVAGIAMGLVQEGERTAVLSDILGDEDHLGDMDFKVAGTRKGITALQMDIKVKGLPRATMSKALFQARDGRMHILDVMHDALPASRQDLSRHAPRIVTLRVKPDQIRDIIGSGGKTIKAIIEQTGVGIDVEDNGLVSISSPDADAAQKAIDIIKGLTREPEVGEFYMGIVRRVVQFGAFVEILPGTDGLVHISDLDEGRVNRVEDICREGDEMLVKVTGIDGMGKIRLSRKEALGIDPAKAQKVTL